MNNEEKQSPENAEDKDKSSPTTADTAENKDGSKEAAPATEPVEAAAEEKPAD